MDLQNKQFKILVVFNIMIIALLLIICIILLTNNKTSDDNKTTNNTTSSESDYDVSMMNQVNLKDVIELFDSKKQYVLYIGRSTCSSCKKFLPSLQAAQEEFGYTTQYLDITTIDGNSSEMKQFVKLLDLKTKVNVTNDDGDPEEVEDTYGNLLNEYGFTPVVIIINDGKMVAGNIGSMSTDAFQEFLKQNGVN